MNLKNKEEKELSPLRHKRRKKAEGVHRRDAEGAERRESFLIFH